MIFSKRFLPLLFAFALFGCDQSNEPDSQAVLDTQTPTEAVTNDASTTATQNTSTLPASAPTYTVLFDHSYPPFSFKDEYGIVTGFEVDLIKAIGEEAGFKVETRAVPWEGIFEKLETGSADLVGGVSVTPERLELYDFTESYIVTDVVFAYKGAPKSYEDIIKGTISAQENTSYISMLRDIPEIEESHILGYPTSYLAFQKLITDEVDATFNNRAILVSEINSVSEQIDVDDLQITPIPDTDKDITAFAIKKGNTELLEQVNMGLQRIKKSGEYNEIEQKWFKSHVFDVGE